MGSGRPAGVKRWTIIKQHEVRRRLAELHRQATWPKSVSEGRLNPSRHTVAPTATAQALHRVRKAGCADSRVEAAKCRGRQGRNDGELASSWRLVSPALRAWLHSNTFAALAIRLPHTWLCPSPPPAPPHLSQEHQPKTSRLGGRRFSRSGRAPPDSAAAAVTAASISAYGSRPAAMSTASWKKSEATVSSPLSMRSVSTPCAESRVPFLQNGRRFSGVV